MSMNLRKWGGFAGNLGAGLSSGLGTGMNIARTQSTLKTAGLEQEQKRNDIDYQKRRREMDTKFFKNLAGLQSGAISPEQFYKSMSEDLGFAQPETQPMMTAPAPPPAADPTSEYAGPGLGTV